MSLIAVRIGIVALLSSLCIAPLFLAAETEQAMSEILAFIPLSIIINLILVGALLIRITEKGGSLALVHMTATWLMLCWGAWVRYLNGEIKESFFGFHSEGAVVLSNVSITSWSVTFYLVYMSALKRLSRRANSSVREITTRGVTLQLLVGAICLGYLAVRVGTGVLTRSMFDESFAAQSPMEGLLIQFPIRMASIFALAMLIYRTRGRIPMSRTPRIVLAAVVGMFILILNNPLAAPRFFTGSVLLGFSYGAILSTQRWKNIGLLVLLIAGSLLFLPLDFGRHQREFGGAAEATEITLEKHLSTDCFRAYEVMPATIEFVGTYGSRRFIQLAGNLLFFIPRSIWPEKPGGSGDMIGNALGLDYTNIATPLPAEGYVNCGFFGVFVLAILFGLLLAYLDHRLDVTTRVSSASLFPVFASFMLGNVFFLTRGDLLSPMAFGFSMALGGIGLLLLSTRSQPLSASSAGAPQVSPSLAHASASREKLADSRERE